MKISTQLIRCFNQHININDDTVFDRFGILEEFDNKFSLPSLCNDSYIDISLKRVKQLGPQTIFWMGGIDSCYTVCCYVNQNVDFKVETIPYFLENNLPFYHWMKDIGCDVVVRNNIKDLTGNYLFSRFSAVLFEPRAVLEFGVRKKAMLENLKHYKWTLTLYLNQFGFSYNDLPLEQLYRILSYALLYYRHGDTLRQVLKIRPENYLDFYDTQKFTDLSWTRYLDWSYEHSHKLEERMFMVDVTKDKKFYELPIDKYNNPYIRNFVLKKIPVENFVRID